MNELCTVCMHNNKFVIYVSTSCLFELFVNYVLYSASSECLDIYF